jgi:hypothetical protein
MGKLRLAFGLLVTAAVFGAAVYFGTPGLLRDWRLRSAETIEVASEMTDGRCRTYLLVVNYCSYTLQTPGGQLEDSLFFVDFRMGRDGYDIVARTPPSDPTQITTSLALNMFWDRVLTMAGFLLLLALGFFNGIGQLLKREPQPAT